MICSMPAGLRQASSNSARSEWNWWQWCRASWIRAARWVTGGGKWVAGLQSVVDTSRQMIDEQGHKLTVDLPAAPILLDADPTRLAQVFSKFPKQAHQQNAAG